MRKEERERRRDCRRKGDVFIMFSGFFFVFVPERSLHCLDCLDGSLMVGLRLWWSCLWFLSGAP